MALFHNYVINYISKTSEREKLEKILYGEIIGGVYEASTLPAIS
jgi:hypothetical protein